MNRHDLLMEIQLVEFVSLELQLYLDTHPADKSAVAQFNQSSAELQELKGLYEKKFGPLLGFGFSQSKRTWQWINDPWPWQINRRC
ncbi:spore coat protein CotJB [Rossellomorea vietnamensis]|uniref:Spore coat protein CotJB n=1 Tax=Rossellomorea vietnamensis TaxID=218284 RepID=A0A5D4M7R2_9BACI|nr:spore coat protein CotJB [Rossellomorea vietnamensis]TYR97403.1 spore coat protein CotJB [Rossellomorea vietnamensis]